MFETFLKRLSSTIFSYSFRRETVLSKHRPNDKMKGLEYDRLIRKYIRVTNELQTLHEFKDSVKKAKEQIEQELLKLNFSNNQINEFKQDFSSILLDEFKTTYIKIILIKVIVYTFFKKKSTYFNIYLHYNQPDDSDAIWASKYFGIESLEEIFKILPKAENLILQDSLFHIGHHGFKVYLNTFLAYYLLNSAEAESINRIKSIQDYSSIVMIEYAIKNIQEQNRIILIEDLLKKNQPTSIKNFRICYNKLRTDK